MHQPRFWLKGETEWWEESTACMNTAHYNMAYGMQNTQMLGNHMC